jgi:hypothetical protein
MGRIPVGRTIAESYGFVFRKYFDLLGIAWLPLTIMAVASYFYAQLVIRDGLIAPSNDPAMAAQMAIRHIPFTLGFYLVMLATIVMISTGVASEAMGERRGPRFVYFRFGANELRASGAILLLIVMIYAAIIVASIIGGIVGAVVFGVHAAASGSAQSHANPMAAVGQIMAVVVLVLLVAAAAASYFAIRLGFLLFPVTVTERRFGLWRSWELTKRNSWRAFAVIFVTCLPILVIDGVILAVTLGPTYLGMLRHLGNPQALAEQSQQLRMMMQRQLSYYPFLWAIGFIFAPFLYGLWIAPAAFAYRALIPGANADVAKSFD